MNELNILVDEWSILQAGVDQAIYERFEIEEPKSLISGLILALKVEAGELANVTRCFKHWSAKGPEDKATIADELADNFAFTLSIGLINGHLLEQDTGKRLFFPRVWEYGEPTEAEEFAYKADLTYRFNRFFSRIETYEACNEYVSYIKLLQELCNLAALLGFTLAEVDEAYRKKTGVNHERQEAGY